MRTSLLQNVLWFSGPVLQSVVAVTMIRRRLVKRFPIFAGYTVFHVLLFAVTYPIHRISYLVYFDVYWGAEIIDMIFVLFVIQELFSDVFAPYQGIRSVGRVLFRSAALILIFFSILLARSGGSRTISPFLDRIVSLKRSVHVFEISILLVLFLACGILGIVWYRFTFGIAVGMGLALSGEAIAATLRAQLGVTGNPFYIWLEPISATCATLTWAFYAISRDRQVEAPPPTAFATQIASWNHALEHFFSKS